MYHAKQLGRNRCQFFSPEMNAHVVERVELEEALKQALARGEFELAYLPEVDIASGHTVGVEALIRWRHPERGVLLPAQFLAAAEECGLGIAVGDWVLREACRQALLWREAGAPVVVAVNLSPQQFLRPDLLAAIDGVLAQLGLPPEWLEVEITESAVMRSNDNAIAVAKGLRERGIRVTIDDFGTGYSSIGALRHVPMSRLKIDRSLIGEITRAPDDAAIIPGIIALARSLNVKVLAEGVENEPQFDYLREHGCDEIQGSYASMLAARSPPGGRSPLR